MMETWWEEEKAEKQIKQEEERKNDNGERAVMILITYIINDFNNYICKKLAHAWFHLFH